MNNLNLNEQSTSIIQITDKKYCFIIDFSKLKSEEKFVELFIVVFKDKVFLAYLFRDDLKNFCNAELPDIF